MKHNEKQVPDFVERGIDLGHPSLGTRIVECSDDFFADRNRLLNPEPPVYIPDKFDENGKWMDGWESRRKRVPGHDHCIIRLGVPGIVHGFDVDTRHFTGNYPPQASLERPCSDMSRIRSTSSPLSLTVSRDGSELEQVAIVGERPRLAGR